MALEEEARTPLPHLCPALGGWRLPSRRVWLSPAGSPAERVGPWLNTQDSRNCDAPFSLGVNLDSLSFKNFAIEKLISR